MAERVRAIMEAMVPEFEDLRKRGLCDEGEVKALVKRREAAEYRLARRAPTKEDFLHAIQLEMNLAALIRLRRKRMGMPKRGASDFAVRKRVHFIYDRALRRFKGDETLWLQWADYAEKTSARARLGRLFAKALALLPNSSALWIRAASWELESRQNLSGARRLLQRALRMNGTDGELWHCYFRLELLCLHKLHARRKQLGLVSDEGGEDDDGDEEEEGEDGGEEEDEEEDIVLDGEDDGGDGDILSALKALDGSEDDAEGGDGSEDDDEDDDDEDDEDDDEEDDDDAGDGGMSGDAGDGEHGATDESDDVEGSSIGKLELPWLVFKHLKSSLPTDVAVQLRCLRTCFDFPRTKPLRQRIERSLCTSHKASPEAAIGLAAMPFERLTDEHWSEAHAAAVRIGLKRFESFVGGTRSGGNGGAKDGGDGGSGGSGAVWEAYGAWLESLLRHPRVPSSVASKLRRRCVSASSRAHESGVALPRTYARWALLRLLGTGASRGLVGAAGLAELATQPEALRQLIDHALLSPGSGANGAAEEEDDQEEDDDEKGQRAASGSSGDGVAASVAPVASLRAALKICSSGLRRPSTSTTTSVASTATASASAATSSIPPLHFTQLLLLISLQVQLGFSHAVATTTAGGAAAQVDADANDADDGDDAAVAAMNPPKRRKRSAGETPRSPEGRLVASPWSPSSGVKLTKPSAAAPAADLLALLAPFGEAGLVLARRHVSPSGASASSSARAAAAARAAETAEVTLGVWTVWIRLAMATPTALTRPTALLELLQRGVNSLRGRGGALQTLVTGWLCARFGPRTVRALAPKITALPATPLSAFEALLVKLTRDLDAPTAAPGNTTPVASSSDAAAATRSLFEAALSEHGHEACSLWRRYAQWHKRRGEFAQASAVHARALRSLDTSLHQQLIEG